MSVLDESCAQLKNFEGAVPWLYRDTLGNMTVGVGKMLPTLDAALALPLQIAAPGEAASADEVADDWTRLMAMPFGQEYAAHTFRAPTSCFLLPAEIDALLEETLGGFDAALRAGLPGYDALPDSVKLALLDMAYNLGAEGLLKGYPKMLQAVEARDWLTAAAECHRAGISDARNQWTATQFQQALAV